MKKFQIACLIFVTFLLCGAVHAQPAPLIELGFANSDLINSGTLAGTNGWMTDGTTPVYVPGVAAALGNDMSAVAMDNTLTNPTQHIGLMVGNNEAWNPGPVANALNGSVSFTVSGWFYSPSTWPVLGAQGHAWKRRENTQPYHYNIRSHTDAYSRPRGTVNNVVAQHPPYQFWNYRDSWFFGALTYDSATSTLIQYRALNTVTNVIPVVYTLAVGPLNASDYGIMFGERNWYAYMDNLRVHASKIDGTGALTAAQLDVIFAQDKLQEIPEPATIAMLALGAGLVWRRRRS